MSRTLDRSKPFGTIHGGHGAAFTQEGAEFDAQGEEVTGADSLPKTPVRRSKAKADTAQPPEAVSDQLTEQLLS
jgi:hypothetical protein